MFEKLLENLLEEILGEYVSNISKDQISVGVWSGKIDIKNLKLRKEICQKFGLPFKLTLGVIE